MPTSYDQARRKRAHRKGRERGCHVYIAADELRACGIDPNGAPPDYRVWPGRKRTVLVQLYEAGSP